VSALMADGRGVLTRDEVMDADAGAIATATFKDWQPDAQAGPMR
jgi:urease gamma subunit